MFLVFCQCMRNTDEEKFASLDHSLLISRKSSIRCKLVFLMRKVFSVKLDI